MTSSGTYDNFFKRKGVILDFDKLSENKSSRIRLIGPDNPDPFIHSSEESFIESESEHTVFELGQLNSRDLSKPSKPKDHKLKEIDKSSISSEFEVGHQSRAGS